MMSANGISKVIEETGEFTAVAGKLLAYWHAPEHPDKAGDLRIRLTKELADLYAANWFFAKRNGLIDTSAQPMKAAALPPGQSLDAKPAAKALAGVVNDANAIVRQLCWLIPGVNAEGKTHMTLHTMETLRSLFDRMVQEVAVLIVLAGLDREMFDAQFTTKIELFTKWHGTRGNDKASWYRQAPTQAP